MAQARLRVSFDANVLIAGSRWPRWSYEVMQSALEGKYQLVLTAQVLDEARENLRTTEQIEFLEYFLAESEYEPAPIPTAEAIRQNSGLVRSKKDVPIALALMAADVDVFVSNDRDFTEVGATHERFRNRVRVLLPAVFLRDIIGWDSDALEAIRNLSWGDSSSLKG